MSRIVVDRSDGELIAYDDDRMIAAYPATIGSASNPSPSGTHKIKAVVKDPSYTYDPDKNFQQGETTNPLKFRRVQTAQSDRSGSTFRSRPMEFTARPSLTRRQDQEPWLRATDELGCTGVGRVGGKRCPG